MKKERLIPKNSNLVIKPIELVKEDDGIYLGREESFICARGEVLEVPEHASEYTVGEIVVYRKSSQSAFVINGEKVHIVKEDSIDGVIKTTK